MIFAAATKKRLEEKVQMLLWPATDCEPCIDFVIKQWRNECLLLQVSFSCYGEMAGGRSAVVRCLAVRGQRMTVTVLIEVRNREEGCGM